MKTSHRARLALAALSSTAVLIASCSSDDAPAESSVAITAPPTTVPEVCEVTEILVPTCGAWLGASTPSADGTFDYETGLQEYEAVVGDSPDIQHFYKRGGAAFPTPAEIALAERPGTARSILFYNWKPSVDHTWREIADGAADDNIAAVAASIAAYPHHLFLAVQHEPEDDAAAGGAGMSASDFVEMYRYVVGRLRELGADNIVFVMNYTGTPRWAPVVDSFYPGDDVVDWIAYDPYALADHTTFSQMLNNPAEGWPGFYEWATAKAPGKPIMLAEFGFDVANRSEAAHDLPSAADVLRDEFPMIKALVYWNDSNDGRLQVRIDQDDQLAAAYTVFARDPYFARVPTSLAP
ncbi:MAG: glycosyl hydrolase [Ilumatobacteraceae bacterium]